jgi:DNA-binding NarL/FixJ family response regulator
MSRVQITQVVIVYDCLFAAECLAIGLAADPGISVVAFTEEEAALSKLTDQTPDSIVIYLTSPWPGPLQLTSEINTRIPAAKIILLGVPLDDSYILDCIKAGAKGWLHKSASLQQIRETLTNTNESEGVWAPRLANIMFRCLCELAATGSPNENTGPATISTREMQVMELLAEHKSNEEIAALLHLSVHTVKRHVHNLLTKLQLRHRTQLVQTAGFAVEL